MGGWGRRIEVRDVVVVAAICALLGAVLSWLIFVWAGDQTSVFGFGALADWVAAAGTWAIGYGAWKYAREAHVLRCTEVDDRATEERTLKERRLNYLISKASLATKFSAGFKGIQKDTPFHEMPKPTKEGAFEILEGGLGRLTWAAEDVARLPRACQTEVNNIEITVLQLRQFIRISAGTEHTSTVYIQAIEDALSVLQAEGERLKSLIEEERDGLRPK